MYEARWLRPGPGLVAIAAGIGFLAGSILGLTIPAGSGQAAPPATTAAPVVTTSTLPERFWTVIVASRRVDGGRASVEAVAQELQRQGVPQIGILEPSRYSIDSRYFAVYSGTFASRAEAEARREQLVAAGLRGPYVRGPITRRA